ncbi:MAG: hypothetical protein FGM61_06725 [Sediminibacterium sp.]|nr:hypothetical protein [Sediminibacterium sp.]
MLPKAFLYSVCSLLLQSHREVADHCFIFNRAPEWLLTASKNEIQSVLRQKGFQRFSITENGQFKELLNASHVNPAASLLDTIYQRIQDYQSVLKNCKDAQPQVSYFQWNDYLERTEVYASGPVFVYFNAQLTHIWLDTPLKNKL